MSNPPIISEDLPHGAGGIEPPLKRSRLQGVIQALLLPLLSWGILVALGYSDFRYSGDPYRGILLAISLYILGPMLGLLHWVLLLAWITWQDDKSTPYCHGLLIGGALASGLCWLTPGLLCWFKVWL
jgi:hypothetical protein